MSIFKQKLSEENWDSVYTAKDVHESYNCFVSKITKLHDKCFPLRKVLVRKCKEDKPWITKGLKNACKKKEMLYIRFLMS